MKLQHLSSTLRIWGGRVRSKRRHSADEMAWARSQWEAGHVVPYYLTSAFNLKGLTGPSVDIACGAQEPDVDQWEAGIKYPTWEQLLKTAELCEVSPAALMRRPVDIAERQRLPKPPTVYLGRCLGGRPCFMTFTAEAIAAVVPPTHAP